jgi:DNA polymerase-4
VDRSVLHLDLDTFFVSCERLQNPSLIGKPILVGGLSDRGVVAGCSYEARQYGIHSAMPMKMARMLCPDAIVIRGDGEMYTRYSRMVTEIVHEAAPLYEKASVDEFYIDTTGMDRFVGTYKWAQQLRQTIMKETGLPLSFGLASNKVVAKIATGLSKPNGYQQVLGGMEKGFLAPLSVRAIPMVGEKTYHTLRNMGIVKIKTLQDMPVQMMEDVLGKTGRLLWERANGIDVTPVVPSREKKSISIERTFDRDTIDVNYLRSLVIAMTENLAYQLRSDDKLTACVTVKIRYTDFQTVSKQIQVPYTAADDLLIKQAVALFNALFNRRVMVRLVGIKFSNLIQGGFQIDLFEHTERELALLKAMDSIRNDFGQGAVKRAVAVAFKQGRQPAYRAVEAPKSLKDTKDDGCC